MSEWTWKIIDDLGQIVTGKTPSTKCPEYWDGDIPFITPKDIQGTKHCEKTERYITNAGSLSAGKVMLGRDAVCVSCIGNIGYVAMTTQNSVTNQQINSIVVNDDHSNDYVYYLMKNLWGYFKTCESQGTSVPILSKSLFSQIPVFVPTIALQRKISAVLSVLDNKIELNHRLNDNLAAMAQALYDYWFVQFDFPDENGKPYKTSGGKMVWNAQLKREIPEEWACVTIQEMADVIGGSTPYTQDPDNFSTVNETGIPWITPKDLSKSTDFYIAKGEVSITEKGRKEASLTYLPPGSILFSSRAPIGYVAIAADFVTTNQGFKSLAPLKPESTPYLFFLMKSMVPYFEQAAGITTFKEVSGSQVKAAKIVKPSDSVLKKFFDVTEPIMNRRTSTETEIKDLTKQRDFLLPLLMNGQVQVKPLNYRLADD